MIKRLQNLNVRNSNLKRLLIGSILSIFVTIIGLIIFASILTYTSVPDNTIPVVTIVITIISILIGTSLCMINIKKNGMINGALVGLMYILTIYMLSSLIEKEFSINAYSMIMIIGSVLAGALGGVIGVNRR